MQDAVIDLESNMWEDIFGWLYKARSAVSEWMKTIFVSSKEHHSLLCVCLSVLDPFI